MRHHPHPAVHKIAGTVKVCVHRVALLGAQALPCASDPIPAAAGRSLKDGKRSTEVTWCLTSLDADRAGPEELLKLVREHWIIENRLHYVRDFTYDEDHVRHMPRNLACLTNAAIAIVRCDDRFRYLPEANRHYAARPQDALDAILNPPAA